MRIYPNLIDTAATNDKPLGLCQIQPGNTAVELVNPKTGEPYRFKNKAAARSTIIRLVVKERVHCGEFDARTGEYL